MSEALYQALIVAHDRAPHHHGPLAGATHAATIDNPLCGDAITMRAIVADGAIAAIAFEGHGCALARAAASMLCARATGATIADVRALAGQFAAFVQAPRDAPVPAELGELGAFAGVRAARSRRTCATLAFRALVAALDAAPSG